MSFDALECYDMFGSGMQETCRDSLQCFQLQHMVSTQATLARPASHVAQPAVGHRKRLLHTVCGLEDLAGMGPSPHVQQTSASTGGKKFAAKADGTQAHLQQDRKVALEQCVNLLGVRILSYRLAAEIPPKWQSEVVPCVLHKPGDLVPSEPQRLSQHLSCAQHVAMLLGELRQPQDVSFASRVTTDSRNAQAP
eukprot:398787-Amphidinium_carterae.1